MVEIALQMADIVRFHKIIFQAGVLGDLAESPVNFGILLSKR